jgi:hypothetical protein
MFRGLMLFCSILAFAYSLLRLADYWEYEEQPIDIRQRFTQAFNSTAMQAQIETEIKNKQVDAANSNLQLAKYFDYPLDYAHYQQQVDAIDTVYYRSSKNIGDFIGGFSSGKGDSGAGVAGALVSDFTVVGDVRDLHQQYQHYQAGNSVNQLIVGLSGVGIGLTIATISTIGVAAPIKAGTSLLKLASKTGKLSARFSQELLQKTNRAFNWNQFVRLSKNGSILGIKSAAAKAYNPRAMKALSSIGDQANNIRKASSTADTVHLLKYVDNSQDLARLEKLALKHGTHSKGIMKVLGKSALRGVKVLKKSLGFLLSLAGLFLSGLFNLYFLFPRQK